MLQGDAAVLDFLEGKHVSVLTHGCELFVDVVIAVQKLLEFLSPELDELAAVGYAPHASGVIPAEVDVFEAEELTDAGIHDLVGAFLATFTLEERVVCRHWGPALVIVLQRGVDGVQGWAARPVLAEQLADFLLRTLAIHIIFGLSLVN